MRPDGGSAPDEALAAAARDGDDDAFRELVERYERPVFSLLLRLVRRREAAEDLAQETFFKAHRALASFDPARKFSSWIFKIAHNAALDELRRRSPEVVSLDTRGGEDEEPAPLPADPRAEDPFRATGGRELGRALERAIATLRPEYREVLLLRFREDLSYEEIAEVTGAPLGTVKIHLHRARQGLARALSELGWDTESRLGG